MGTLPAAVVGLSNANTITSEWRGMHRLGRHKRHFTPTFQRMNQVFNLIGIQASLNYIPITDCDASKLNIKHTRSFKTNC